MIDNPGPELEWNPSNPLLARQEVAEPVQALEFAPGFMRTTDKKQNEFSELAAADLPAYHFGSVFGISRKQP